MMEKPAVDEADLCSDHWLEEDREEARRLQGPIFVIGASGFIGAKLFFSLSRLRGDVYAVSPFVEASWRLLHCPYPNRLSLDITDAREVAAVVRQYRPRTVFNLSAYGAYERQSDAERIHKVNYIGTLNLIRALLETGCDAFVQAGSSSEYGLNCAGPAEDDLLEPNSDYAVSKAASGYLTQFYGRLRGFPATHLRLYSIYGPWEERDRLIPRLLAQAAQKRFPPFAGKDISRDFVFVDDATRAFVKAAIGPCRAAPGRIFNIGSGRKTSLGELAELARRLFAIPGEPAFGSMPDRKWDLSNWYGDPKRAAAEMDWMARHPLAEGLRLTADWEALASQRVRFGAVQKRRERLSAVVACYRDHEAIPVMYERLTATFNKLGVDYEIIFVNDNSPTSDEAVIGQLCESDPHVIGISHSRNFGSQSAFLSGMELATGDAVILFDGDLQDPPEVVELFFQEWKQGHDVVYGVRVRRRTSWYMQVFYKLFYRIFQKLSDVEIPLDAGDFSMIDRRVVEHILRFPERDFFLRGLRAWVGFKQAGVPYDRPERMFGRTTNNFMKNIWWAKKAIFSFSQKPLNYMQGFGIGIVILSALLSIFYLILYLVHPPVGARGVTTIILLVLALGGIQIFSLSILGDYLGKVLEESKARPRFIRSRIVIGRDFFTSEAGIEKIIGVHRAAAQSRTHA